MIDLELADAKDYLKKLDDNSIDLVVIDPPYSDSGKLDIGTYSYSSLVAANDRFASFADIADWIDNNYKTL